MRSSFFFFFQAEDGIRDLTVTGVQTCALPISLPAARPQADRPHGRRHRHDRRPERSTERAPPPLQGADPSKRRSEEHTSELQSQSNLVCRLLLEKKKNNTLRNPLTLPNHLHNL